jgi:hypothetical protein
MCSIMASPHGLEPHSLVLETRAQPIYHRDDITDLLKIAYCNCKNIILLSLIIVNYFFLHVSPHINPCTLSYELVNSQDLYT